MAAVRVAIVATTLLVAVVAQQTAAGGSGGTGGDTGAVQGGLPSPGTDGGGSSGVMTGSGCNVQSCAPSFVASTLAGSFAGDGGPATSAVFTSPTAMARACANDSAWLYIVERGAGRVRALSRSGGIVSTFAGHPSGVFCPAPSLSNGDGGPATLACFGSGGAISMPALAWDCATPQLFIVDGAAIRAVRMVLGRWIIATVAGTGSVTASSLFTADVPVPATSVSFGPITSLAFANGTLFLLDSGSSSVFAFNGSHVKGVIGPSTSPPLSNPNGMVLDATGALIITDPANGCLRRLWNGTLTSLVCNITVNADTAFSRVTVDPVDGTIVASTTASALYVLPRGSASGAVAFPNPSTITNILADGAFVGSLLVVIGSFITRYNVTGATSASQLNATATLVAGASSRFDTVDGAPATTSLIASPKATALTPDGTAAFIVTAQYLIKYVNLTSGLMITYAGQHGASAVGDNGVPATSTTIAFPAAIAVDETGRVYFNDLMSTMSVIRSIDPGTAIVQLFAGSRSNDGVSSSSALLSGMTALVTHPVSRDLYIASTRTTGSPSMYGLITRVLAATGMVQWMVGSMTMNLQANDTALGRSLHLSAAVSALAFVNSSTLLFADMGGCKVRALNVTSGRLSLFAGSGCAPCVPADTSPASSLCLSVALAGMAVRPTDATVFIADAGPCVVFAVAAGVATRIAGASGGGCGFSGDGGPGTAAMLNVPSVLLYMPTFDAVMVVDMLRGSARLRVLTMATRVINTVAGGGAQYCDSCNATNTLLGQSLGLAADLNGTVYVSDTGNNIVRALKGSLGSFNITTVAGMYSVSGYTGDGGPASNALLSVPSALAFDAINGTLYIADTNYRVVRTCSIVAGAVGNMSTFAGIQTAAGGDGGPALSSTLSASGLMSSMAYASGTRQLFLSDSVYYGVRVVSLATGIISIAAGNGQSVLTPRVPTPVAQASFLSVRSIAVTPDGSQLFVADDSHIYSVIAGVVNVVAGAPGTSTFMAFATSALSFPLVTPYQLAAGPAGSVLMAVSSANSLVASLLPNGSIYAIAGGGSWRGMVAPR